MKRRSHTAGDQLFSACSDLFKWIPAWSCLPMSAGFFGLVYFLGISHNDNPVLKRYLIIVALGFAFVILMAGLKAGLWKRRQRELRKQNIDVDWVKHLSWQDFEEQVAEAFRRQGYQVYRLAGDGPDGGVDLVMVKDGRKTLVQCKHWKARKVGVKVVREMLGVMTASAANSAMIVTSGRFTQEAKQFVSGKPIELIEGDRFLALVENFKNPSTASPSIANSTPACPRCFGSMIMRKVRRGPIPGKSFWGCQSYPGCHGTRNVSQPIK